MLVTLLVTMRVAHDNDPEGEAKPYYRAGEMASIMKSLLDKPNYGSLYKVESVVAVGEYEER